MAILKEKGTRCAAHVLTSDRSPSSGSGCELTNARQSTAVSVRTVNLILIRVDGFCAKTIYYINTIPMIMRTINVH